MAVCFVIPLAGVRMQLRWQVSRPLTLVCYQSHPGLLLRLPHDHSVFVYRLELSAKHFAEFPFLLLLCNLSPPGLSHLCGTGFFFGLFIPERE